jgi:hypothetical protein
MTSRQISFDPRRLRALQITEGIPARLSGS